MFPVSPWRGSDSTCTVATDTQFTRVAAKSSSVLEYGELLQHSSCRAKPTPMRSNLRIELCLWIYTIHPLLQCQSSSGSVGKSIWLEFRGPRFESWLDLNVFFHQKCDQVCYAIKSQPTVDQIIYSLFAKWHYRDLPHSLTVLLIHTSALCQVSSVLLLPWESSVNN